MKLHIPVAALLISFVFYQMSWAQLAPFGYLKNQKKKHKDDRIVLDNGDSLTGEIKRVEFGILYFKSDRAVGTLEIDWKRVRSVHSTARFEFEALDGRIFIGIIEPDTEKPVEPGMLRIRTDTGESLEFEIENVLAIHEMQKSFLGRVDLSLDAGITYTQGNNQIQINVDSSLRYSKPRYSLQMAVSSIFSGQQEGEDTERHEFSFLGKRDLSLKWDYITLVSLLRDNQQDLELRTIIGGGLERTFIKTNRTFLSGMIGMAYTRENYIPELDANRNNLEILTGLAISAYKFRSSELNAHVFVFPSLTDAGRVRIDSSAYWRWELVKDFYWKVSVFDNFDNSPPEGSPENSFGVTTAIGWTF